MRYSQVVDADNDDRVQDDDLTQEHDFFLRTFGTENMPTVDRFFHRINLIRNSNFIMITTINFGLDVCVVQRHRSYIRSYIVHTDGAVIGFFAT